MFVDDYWVDYYSDRVSGLVFVVDSTNPGALGEAKEELFKLLANDKFQGSSPRSGRAREERAGVRVVVLRSRETRPPRSDTTSSQSIHTSRHGL